MSKEISLAAVRSAEVLRLFRSGQSKSEIARALGIDKKAVARDLVIAIREAGKEKQ